MGSAASVKKIESLLERDCKELLKSKGLTRKRIEQMYRRVASETKNEKRAFELLKKNIEELPRRKGNKKKRKKKKKKKVCTLSSEDINDIAACSDPLKHLRSEFGGSMSPKEEIQYLTKTTHKTKRIADTALLRRKENDCDSFILQLQDALHFNNDAEEDTLDVSGLKLEMLVFSPTAVKRFVRLDISSNQLRSLTVFNDLNDDRCRTWIRSIDARNNLLCDLKIPCRGFPKLLSLDLSCNHIHTIQKEYFKFTPRLRWLRMRQCGIKCEHLESLMSLEFSLVYVDLGENELRDYNSITTKLLQLSQLEVIDLDGNPFICEEIDIERLRTFFQNKKPRVKTLNGVSLGRADFVAAMKKTRTFDDDDDDDDDGVLTLSDSASCSCLEGNPCISPYNCKDWLHRYEVAERIRNLKGSS